MHDFETEEIFLQRFNQYSDLAYKVANNFVRSKPWLRDEIRNAALFGLWEAVKKDPEGKRESFYSVVIKNQIMYQTRNLDRSIKLGSGKTAGFNKLYYNIDFVSIEITDTASKQEQNENDKIQYGIANFNTIENIVIEKETELERQELLEESILDLTKDQQNVIKALLKGKTVKKLSVENQCSTENINKKKRVAIRHLKEILN